MRMARLFDAPVAGFFLPRPAVMAPIQWIPHSVGIVTVRGAAMRLISGDVLPAKIGARNGVGESLRGSTAAAPQVAN